MIDIFSDDGARGLKELRDLNLEPILNLEIALELITQDSYITAKPFPYVSIDNLFNPQVLNKILNFWPNLKHLDNESHNDGKYVKSKLATTFKSEFNPYIEHFLYQLTKPYFLSYLGELTKTWALLPDPYHFGGGLHETFNGGKLMVHADYNKHPLSKLDRRLNLLIFLNHNWTDEMKGHLELWDHDAAKCEKKILPTFNRTVIFSTHKTSFHGQPGEVQCGENNSRKSIALYYFSNGRPDEDIFEEHSTMWKSDLEKK